MPQPRTQLVPLLCSILLSFVAVMPAAAGNVAREPALVLEDHHDSSPRLSEMIRGGSGVAHFARSEEAPGEEARRPAPASNFPDPVVQSSAKEALSIVAGVNVAGIGEGDYGFQDSSAAPDPTGAAGKTQYVQVVNSSLAVFDKTGKLLAGPVGLNVIWQKFGGACETTLVADPVAQYDKIADRWVIVGQAERLPSGEAFGYVCVAVSQTSDAMGAYNRYAMKFDAIDYQKMGVWPDAYYVGMNGLFNASAISCALDRAAMLRGDKASAVCFTVQGLHTLLPADLYGRTLPPAGAPDYLVGGINSVANAIQLFKFHADFTNPKNSSFSGPAEIAVAPYEPACPASGYYRACIPQNGNQVTLETLSDRLMYRAAYRNFSDHEAIVVTHSVDAGTTSRAGTVGVRWYELRAAEDGNFAVFQQGTYAPDAKFRWMGSAAMDSAGDIAMGYGISGYTMYPSVGYTGRVPTDPLGTMEGERIILSGLNSTTDTMWGDYDSISVDPSDDCTFWYTNQYYKTGQQTNWSTRIASFKFAGCH
jgi:hypothetical protein